MQIDAYLIISQSPKYPYKGSIRVSKNSPQLAPKEVAVKLNLKVPDALFTRPQLQASITVPDNAVSRPVITAEVQDNIQQAVKVATGLDLQITIVEP